MDKRAMWFSAYLLSITVTTITAEYFGAGQISPYLVPAVAAGAVIGWVLISRLAGEQLEPMVDERQQHHVVLSGYKAFLFLNLLLIGALVQPYVSHDHLGLWVGVLVAGLAYWVVNLVLLDRTR